MDFKRVRFAEFVALAAGLLLLVSLFLPWYRFGTLGPTGVEDFARHDGWTSLSGALVPFVAAVLISIYLFVVTLTRDTPALSVAGGVWTTTIGLIAAIFGLVHVLSLPGSAAAHLYGVWLGFVGTVGVLASGWLSMRDERPRRGVAATVPAGVSR